MSGYGPGQHPNSRKNLRSFERGDDPRRRPGSPSAARQTSAHINELWREHDDGTAAYPTDELQRIVESGDSSHPRAIAANLILAARQTGDDKIGRAKSLGAVREWLDRALGKPAQHVAVDVHHSSDVSVIELAQTIAQLEAAFPGLLGEIKAVGAASGEPQPVKRIESTVTTPELIDQTPNDKEPEYYPPDDARHARFHLALIDEVAVLRVTSGGTPSRAIREVVELVESKKVRFEADDDGITITDARGTQRLGPSLAERVRWLIDAGLIALGTR